ncbi:MULTISPECIES: hypothetical protein [unclassified Methylophilus]|uniref:hypothetical protein n=1 Tax=unclassified Methylophilus TaxID=2630143 RepID=UPI0003757012|nr:MULTISPECIES: hypothetical protein [unclassified Methylophilus]
MVATAPQTIDKDLTDKIRNLIFQFEHIPADSFVIRQLNADVDKLMKVDASRAHLHKASLNFLIGDFENVKYHVRVMNGIPPESYQSLYYNSAIVLSNSYLYSEAIGYYESIIAKNELEPYEIILGGYNCLAFIKLNKLIKESLKLKLEFADKDISLAERASAILESANITDAEVAKYADVFGEVLRERRLMIGEYNPTVLIGDNQNNWHPHTVFIIFRVKTDPNVAADIYAESVSRSIQKYGAFPDALHMSVEAI